MANTDGNVCTHLTLGMCPCTPTKTDDFGSSPSSFATKKRKLRIKVRFAARKKSRNVDDLWKFKKVLKESDVGNMTRLMIGRDMAEDFVLPMLNADADEIDRGVDVKIFDVDTDSTHSLVFKKWVSSRSYVFIGNWGKDFVARRGLKKGDEIGFQWNPLNNGFDFSVLQNHTTT
ncbi:B3 domain-containing protein, partial [Mucuna pruriens]